MDGTSVLGTASIVGSAATLTIPLAAGSHGVTAVYSGDANYNPCTSAVNTVVVGQLEFTLALISSASQTVIPGNVASYTVQVAPTNVNYPGTVTLTATGLPPGATISFSPATVAANGGITPSKATIRTAGQQAALNIGGTGSLALAFLMLPLTRSRRIRRSSSRYFCWLLVLIGGVAATSGLTGCSEHNGFFSVAPKTYNIAITAASGTIQHSVNVTLNVQ